MTLKPPTRNERENVIPLINVVFLLLIFFMIAGQMTQPEAQAITPPEVTSEHDIANTEKKLLVGEDGTVMFGDNMITLSELPEMIDPETPVTIKIDKECARDCFLPVLSAVQKSGATKVFLITLQAATEI